MIAEVVQLSDGSKSFRTLSGANGDGLPLGTILGIHRTNVPTGFLPCNGAEFDITQYPSLYTLLGSNKLPDLREAVLVGIGASERSSISQHDVYSLGQFKDDQLQTLDMTIDTSNVEVTINDPGHSHSVVQTQSIGSIDTGTNYTGVDEAVFKGAVKNGTADVALVDPEIEVETSTTGITAEITDGSVTASLQDYRHGTTTHGKQYGINYVIKATTGSIDVNDAEIYADVVAFLDENYIQDDIINLVNGDLVKYNEEEGKYVAIERSAVNGYVLSTIIDEDGNRDYKWVPNGNVSVHIFTTEEEYKEALEIQEGSPGYIYDGDIVLKEWITDVVQGVDYESV